MRERGRSLAESRGKPSVGTPQDEAPAVSVPGGGYGFSAAEKASFDRASKPNDSN